MKRKNRFVKKFFLPLFLLLFVTSIYGNTICDNPFSEEDIKEQCDRMVADFKTDADPETVTEQVVKAVLNKVNIGDKGTFGLEEAYRVSRIQITLFCESEKKLYLDKMIDLGDRQNRKIILVKSCQKIDRDKPGDYYGTVSVQIFLEEIDENNIDINADKTVIKPDETSAISIKLSQADCPVKGKTITLKKQGPGNLPNSALTDESGEAKVQFKAEEEGRTKIEALYQNWSKKIEIITRPYTLWDMDCHIHYYQHHPRFPDLNSGYNDRWRSTVHFKDIPLTRLAEADFTAGYPESSENPENVKVYLKWLKIKKTYNNTGTFTDNRFTVYDGETLHYGKTSGTPEWILGIGVQGEKLDFSEEHEGIKMFIMVKMERGSVMVSINEKAGVKTPWPVRFELRIEFPKEKILAGEPFTLDLKEPHGSISHKNLEIRFTPKKN